MKPIINPFPTTAYIGHEYFCNRSPETKQLLRDLTNGQSVTLTSIRRIGKTGLIRHVLAQLPNSYQGIYVDILATENLNDFFNVLATSALNSIPETSATGKKLWALIRAVRPIFSIDPMTGFPQISVDFKPHETNHHIESILRFLENQPRKIVIAIDEFQQILNYPESRTDAWLRSIIQTLTNVVFIFSGSQQHLMLDLFSNPSRPFFRSTGFLKLEKINKDDYSAFILQHMQRNNRKITEAIVSDIIDWTQCHTYYVQLLCNRVFNTGNLNIKREDWIREAFILLKEQEMMFFNYRDLLTFQQWQLLKALSTEEVVYTPTSKEFMSKYHLGSPATVLRSMTSLMGSELIYSDHTKEGKLYYGVYDVLFQRWIQQHSFGKL